MGQLLDGLESSEKKTDRILRRVPGVSKQHTIHLSELLLVSRRKKNTDILWS